MQGQGGTVKTDRLARAMMALVIGLLALPAVVGVLRSNAEAVRTLEHRARAARPPLALLRENSRAYIDAWDAHLKDAIGFRLRANALYRKIRYAVLRDPPLPNITLGRGGHLFLNGARPDAPYRYMRHLCETQGDPPAELLDLLDATFAAASRYFADRGAQVTIAVIPTTLTLYADKLPLTVPSAYRRACLDYPQKDHALARLERRGAASGRYRLFYPHALFAAHRDEAHFYPKERYHCEGKSVSLFTRHLLKASGATADIPPEDPATLARVPNDIAIFFGYGLPATAWTYAHANRPTKTRHVQWLRKAFGGKLNLLARSDTDNSLTPKTALMIGNSFGTSVSPHLARGFKRMYFLDTNNFTPGQDRAAVFAAVAERVRPDFVYFVFDDINLTNLPVWLAGFVELERQEAKLQHPAPQESTPQSP